MAAYSAPFKSKDDASGRLNMGNVDIPGYLYNLPGQRKIFTRGKIQQCFTENKIF